MLTEWHFNYEARFLNQFFCETEFCFYRIVFVAFLWRFVGD